MFTQLPAAVLLLATMTALAHADTHAQGEITKRWDPEAKLDKPALLDGFGDLKTPLWNAGSGVVFSAPEHKEGWIPADCKMLAEKEGHDAADVKAYEAKYNDCDHPWYFCVHKDAPATIGDLTDTFSRVPARARTWVRHIILLPSPSKQTWAYNLNGNIVFFDEMINSATTLIHETSHSLDLLGAYKQDPQNGFGKDSNDLSKDDEMKAAYDKDSKVPDSYSQSSMAENVAQLSVVTAYNLNVGAFGDLEDGADTIYNQLHIVRLHSDAAGGLLKKGGTCGKRLENSDMVNVGKDVNMRRGMRAREVGEKPDVKLAGKIEIIPPKEFSTEEICKHF